MEQITIRTPDDWHVHLRDGPMMQQLVRTTADHFARALVMPNLTPPVLTAADALAYRERIIEATHPGFNPLMTIKILPATKPEWIKEAKLAGVIAGKLYPQGVTTNSEDGWNDITALEPVFAAMEEAGMVLCLHGENPDAFCLDRERRFVDVVLPWLTRDFPKLRIVLEHVTTAHAVHVIQWEGENVAGTITAHHLLLTLDDVIGGSLKPHHFCKPIAKRPGDRRALISAAMHSPKFFLGTDSAPHPRSNKECASGCAGVFTAPIALGLVAEVFHEHGGLSHLEAFTSERGAAFYGLPLNEGSLTLQHGEWPVPENYAGVVPLRAGGTVKWQVASPTSP